MLFRAIFWIGLVSVLMPREPDLGFGRPGPGVELTTGLLNWIRPAPKVDSPNTGSTTRSFTLRSLAQVKADIAAARHSDF